MKLRVRRILLSLSIFACLGGTQAVQAQTTYTAGAALVSDEAGSRGTNVVAVTSDGIWSFGTKTSATTGWAIMPSTWHVDSFGYPWIGTQDNAFAGWSEDNCAPGDCVPVIAVNTTLGLQGWVGGTEFAPAKFWVHPNQADTTPGACVAVRWTAPEDGTANVSAVWEGKYNGCGDGVSTHVAKNDGLITGSQLDGAYPPLNTPLVYTSIEVPVLAGDTIDFSTCPQTSYSCDSTQFDAMVTLTPAAEQLSCEGFMEPFAGPLSVKRKTKRNLPLKFQLFDSDGVEMTDLHITAPRVNVVMGGSQGSDIVGYEEESLPGGLADDGNEFYYDGTQWVLVLGLKAYSGPGTYEISAVAGDSSYEIDGCTQEFTRLP